MSPVTGTGRYRQPADAGGALDARNSPGAAPGDRGRLTIRPAAVARIATAAAAEVHAVDPPPGQAGRHRHPRDQARGIRRIRGRVRARGRTRARGAGPVRSGSAQRRGPRATAEVTGSRATVALVLSVRYPQPVLQVAAEVRDRVTARISQLCALEVTAVTVDVLAFTPPAERGRVQ